ncbi:MAG TPA: TonB-dependent receptor [Vicinamibacterales bacterium]|nr:TonB-dependent receptor [Vicinamibacterales bacterium]
MKGNVIVVIAVWLLAVGSASAQTIGSTVQGLVTDTTGSVVAGAQVAVTNVDTGARLATRSDDGGWFHLTLVPAGRYQLEVTQNGFRRHVRPVTLAVNQGVRADVVLEPGPVSETVTVTASDVILDRLSASRVTRIAPDRLANLPLDGRNFLDLVLLSAGTTAPAQGSAGSVRGDFTFNASGAREDSNVFLLDGAYNVDPKLNTVAVRPPVDAIREFEVITNLPDASFGRSAGAQVNVITRSGSNRMGATAYDFFRTSAFNSRNFFAPENEPAPEYRRHQFGGSVGGPIARDRWFFFADYEGTRLTEGITRLTTVPTLEERRGNFSNSRLPAPFNPFAQQPFPGAQIPDFLQHPTGAAIAALYPEPNRPGQVANFVSSPALADDTDQFDVRIDRAGRSQWMVRYSFANRALFEPFAGPTFAAVPGFGTSVPRRAQNLVVSATTPLGGAMVNEVRAGWTRVKLGAFHEGQGTSLNQELGLPELSDDPRDFGLSYITVAGFSPLGDEFNNPQESTTNMLHVSDSLSWTRGRHLVRRGGEVRLLGQDAYRDVQSRGFLQFTNQAFTGNGLADLLLGLPTVTGGAIVDNPQDLRTHSYALFVQDSIQVASHVTFTAGLRYEFNQPPVDRNNRVTLYDPESGTIVPVGQGGVPRGGYRPDRNNVAPRLGLAWSLSDSTVLRGGYGISYDQASLAPNEFLYFNSPYFDLNLFFSLPPDFLLTLTDPFPAGFPLPLPDSATAVQRDLATGYLHQWNVSLAQQLGRTRSVELAYVGSRGRSLVAARDINQPAPSTSPFNPRPNPFFADILMIESRARSEYDALEVRFDQRLDRGLAFAAAYTLGQSMDDASGFFSSAADANFPQDSNNPSAEWARSNFDVRHRMTVNGVWQLPFGPGRRWLKDGVAGLCLGNWDVHAVATFASGRPFTVAVHPDIDISNTGRTNLGFGFNDRPNQTGSPDLADPSHDGWFNTAAFTMPPFGSFGDVGRNSLEGPGFRNVNLALVRDVNFGASRLQLRIETFNLFNSTNFDLPDSFLGSPTFGQILSAGAPRRFQLGLRLAY